LPARMLIVNSAVQPTGVGVCTSSETFTRARRKSQPILSTVYTVGIWRSLFGDSTHIDAGSDRGTYRLASRQSLPSRTWLRVSWSVFARHTMYLDSWLVLVGSRSRANGVSVRRWICAHPRYSDSRQFRAGKRRHNLLLRHRSPRDRLRPVLRALPYGWNR